jgi:hypothetical protein
MEKKGELELAKSDKQLTITETINNASLSIPVLKEQLLVIKSELNKLSNEIHINSYKGFDAVKDSIETLKLVEENRRKAERSLQIYYTLKIYKDNSIKDIDSLIKNKEFEHIVSFNRLFSLLTDNEKSIELMSSIDNDLTNAINIFIDKFKSSESASIKKGFIMELISEYGHLSLVDFNVFFKMCLRRDFGDIYGLSVAELVRMLSLYDKMKQEMIEKHNEAN